MQKDLACYDEMSLVTNLRPGDEVLIIGKNLSLPFVDGAVRIERRSEIDRMLHSERRYDRIFIGRENFLSEDIVTRAVILLKDDGLMCFMSDHGGLRYAFAEIIESNYPEAGVWEFESNLGTLVVTNAKGASRWLN